LVDFHAVLAGFKEWPWALNLLLKRGGRWNLKGRCAVRDYRKKWRAGLIAMALLAGVVGSGSSQAADVNKKYKIEGAGVLSCSQYLEARKKQSPLYFRLLARIIHGGAHKVTANVD
jgi:hypothetical protein